MSMADNFHDLKGGIEAEYARETTDALDDSSEPAKACSCYTRLCCDI